MKIAEKPIVLRAHTDTNHVGVVRLSSEAEKVVRRLNTKSGLPIRTIVSEIIAKAERLIATADNEL